jgi:hypothetical protein
MAIARVSGTVLDVRFQQGADYSNHSVKVLVGKADVTEVKFGDRYADSIPQEGDEVDLLVSVSAYKSERSGAAGLSIRALRPYEETAHQASLSSVV